MLAIFPGCNLIVVCVTHHVTDTSNADTLAQNVLGYTETTGSDTDHGKPDNVILTASATQARKPMNAKHMHDDYLLSGVVNSIENRLNKT